ncbi:Cytosolic protein [Tumidithrix helvetica PCC 7403]
MLEGASIYGFIPEKGLDFIVKNFRALSSIGVLEQNWMDAYTHASNFEDIPLDLMQEIFDTCDRELLQKNYPIYVGDHFNNGERFSLFRGCAGLIHKKGMSWTSSLDIAIWYAAHHAEYYDLDNVAVYAAVVNREEIYCCGCHYDYDFIVRPKEWWRIEVPQSEFRLDRPR